MIKKLKIIFTYLCLATFIFSFTETYAGFKRKPKWITKRPVNQDFYIGIGKSLKNIEGTNYIQTAKNNALSDIISEISVQISSNSILNQFEDNSGYKESYEAQIKVSAKDDIEGYELVDSWENKEEYWVYYKLSKAEYEKKKRERLEKAKSLSKDFYEKAKESEKTYDIHNALVYYVKAFDAIKKHLGEDLSVFTFDGRIHLDNAVFQSIQNIFSRILIVPGKDVYSIKALSTDNEPVYTIVKLRTELETQNISNLPIVFSFTGLDIEKTETVLSLNNGKAECSIANMAPKGRTQIIKAELNTDFYLGEDSKENILKNLFNNNIKPYGNLNVEVKELFAYIESQEILFDNISQNNPITRLFKEELSENFFSFTNNKENADVYIKINSEISKGKKLEKHNLYTSYLNCNISFIRAKDNIEIFNDKIQGLKGMKTGSFEMAAQDAISKAKQKVVKEIIPNIREINL